MPRACARWASKLELGFAFDVEEQDARLLSAAIHLPGLLADAGEDDTRKRFGRGTFHAFEFAAGDDVEAAAEPASSLRIASEEFAFTA